MSMRTGPGIAAAGPIPFKNGCRGRPAGVGAASLAGSNDVQKFDHCHP